MPKGWEPDAHSHWHRFCGPLARPVLSARRGSQTQQGAVAPDELSGQRESEGSVLGLERPFSQPESRRRDGPQGQRGQ